MHSSSFCVKIPEYLVFIYTSYIILLYTKRGGSLNFYNLSLDSCRSLRKFCFFLVCGVFALNWGILNSFAAEEEDKLVKIKTQIDNRGVSFLDIIQKGRLHVFGNVDFRFDSNPSILPKGQETPDFLMRLKAGTSLFFPSDKLSVNFSGYVDWTQYFGAFSKNSMRFSGLQGGARFELSSNKTKIVSFTLSDVLTRFSAPASSAIPNRMQYFFNQSSFSMIVNPRSKAVDLLLAYDNAFSFYDAKQPSVDGVESMVEPRAFSSMTHSPKLSLRWKILPKTVLVSSVNASFYHYLYPSTTLRFQSSSYVRSFIGFLTPISDRITIGASIGYVGTFVNADKSQDPILLARSTHSVLANADISWRVSSQLKMGVNYARDFQPVAVFNYYSSDIASIGMQYSPDERISLGIRCQYSYMKFGVNSFTGGVSKIDHDILGDLKFSWRIKNWVSVGVSYTPNVRYSSLAIVAGVIGQYVRHNVSTDFTFTY